MSDIRLIVIGLFLLTAFPAHALESLDSDSPEADVNFREAFGDSDVPEAAQPSNETGHPSTNAASRAGASGHRVLRTRRFLSLGISKAESVTRDDVETRFNPSWSVSGNLPLGRYFSLGAGYSLGEKVSVRQDRFFTGPNSFVNYKQELFTRGKTVSAGGSLRIAGRDDSAPYIRWSRLRSTGDGTYEESAYPVTGGVAGHPVTFKQELDTTRTYAVSYGAGYDHLVSPGVEVTLSASHLVVDDRRYRSISVASNLRLGSNSWVGFGFTDAHDAENTSFGMSYLHVL